MEKNGVTSGEFKVLALEFTRRGSLFVQKRRVGDVCLYERRDDDGYRCWEVIVVQRQKSCVRRIGGVDVVYEAKERYPSDEEFGHFGWSYGLEVLAVKKYESLICG
mgnify:FL=1